VGGDAVTYHWADCDRNVDSQRYDRLAKLIPLFEWLLFLPRDMRRNAVTRMGLSRGDSVLCVGCGTGRNFPFMHEAVGPEGRIYGIDISRGMLREAAAQCQANQWRNIELSECDAADYTAPEPLDGILFSLSYNTMPHHLTVLRKMWQQLRPGGRLVIMDAKVPKGPTAKLILPFSLWLMKHTLLGNPLIHPWKDLANLTEHFEMSECMFGSYYICQGMKPLRGATRVGDDIAANDPADIDIDHRIAAE
jgi:demethylmenaquinone methyltransferase/2-methoxy-6-polyprenyl-1,4-benzoquinol methylase